MMQTPIRTEAEPVSSPLLLSILSTTIKWLVNEEELNRAVAQDMQQINELSRMSDAELSELGITRDQIVAYVLQENAED